MELEMRINTGGGGGNGALSSVATTTTTSTNALATGDEGHLSDEASPLRGTRAGRLGSSLTESPLATQQQG
jgi:hypothetical protein